MTEEKPKLSLREQEKLNSLEKKVRENLKFIACKRAKTHGENHLNMVCFDTACNSDKYFLEPVCSVCLDEKVHARHPHITKNLKFLLIEIAKQIDLINSKSFQQEKFREVIEVAKGFRALGEQCTAIAQSIISVLKEARKDEKEKNEVSEAATQLIEEIMKSSDAKKLSESLRKLQKLTLLKEDRVGELRRREEQEKEEEEEEQLRQQILDKNQTNENKKPDKQLHLVLKKSEHSDLNMDLNFFKEKMNVHLLYLQNAIRIMEHDSHNLQQIGVQCLAMQPSEIAHEHLQSVQILQPDMLFEGTADRFGRLFSREAYDHGTVTLKFVLEKVDFPNFFSFGLIKDSAKAMPHNDFNRIFHSFFDSYNANMSTFPIKRTFRNVTKEGVIFYAFLDFNHEVFEIRECTGQVKAYYDRNNKNLRLDGEAWRFYIYMKGAHRIRILN